MKEQYYSNALIDKQARLFLEKIMPLRDIHHYEINPKTTALLIIDCQRFFFQKSSHAFIPSAKAIIRKILKLHKCCSQKGIMVVATKHINTPENAYMMKKWWDNHLILENDHLSEVIPEILALNIPVIVKSQYDALFESTLNMTLRLNNIRQLIITGVMTHLCCETTARAAFTRGYEVFFAIDGTATYNREFHLGTLVNLAHGFAVPMLTSEIIDQL